MLEAKHSGSAHTNPSQTLLAFKPRQVLLAEHNKKATTMKKHYSSKTLTLNPEQKALLLHSVLGYLEGNGFSRTLKRLLSEAQIENDKWKTCSVKLEDMYGNHLETCTCDDTNFDTYKEQELLTEGITKKETDSHCSAFEQTVGKKKKKRSDESDGNAAVIQSGTANKFAESAKNSREILANDLLTDSNVELKEKKKNKKVSDSVSQTEQVSAQALKVPATDTVCELQTDEPTKKQKDKKKKKSQSISESLDGIAAQVQSRSLPTVNEEKCKNLKPSLGDGNIDSEAEGKSKDNRKKKKKKQNRDLVVENIEQCNSALENMHDIPLEDKKVESKYKRKKEGSVSETLSGGVAELANKDDPMKSELKKGWFQTSEDAIDKEKKSSKKRKRLASDENEGWPIEKLESEELKRRKTEHLEQTKSCEQHTEVKDNDHAGKESKVGNCHVGQNEFQNTSIKQLEAHSNGNLEKSGQKSDAQKTRSKQHNGSAEPKTINAFQRVKVDEVEFVDERLQDNSYWAKDGAEVGYGAKAQEILGQVRGRDFRHEKTKKKRGSYRGGQIDLHSHSVKFNYSDED